LACNATVPTDPLANQTSPAFTNPTHATVKRVWDTTGETVTRTSPEGRISTTLRDSQGRVKSLKIGSLTPTLYTYDPAHPDQLQYIDRGARRTELNYRGLYESDPVNQVTPDADAGFVKRIHDAVGINTDFTRDIYARAKSVTEAKSVAGQEGSTSLDWDGNGNLKLVTPPGKPTHNLLYDAINGLKQYTPPTVTGIATPQTTYAVTADRTPLSETRPDGVTITRSLVTSPALTDQLDTIVFSGGTSPSGTVDYDYFPSSDTLGPGKVQTIKGPYGTTKLSLTYNGQLTTSLTWDGDIPSHSNWGNVAWGYNSRFLKSHETVTPGGTSYISYDNDGLVSCVSPNGSSVATPNEAATCPTPLLATDLKLTRSAEHGIVTDVVVGPNVSEHIDYSDSAGDDGGADTDVPNNRAFGELRHQKATYGATALAEFTYDSSLDPRDNLGRIQVKTEKFGTAASTDIVYGYDERGRLETVDAGANSESFTYDTNGNRTSYTGPSGAIASGSIVYDNQDRLTSYGSTTFTYGKNGEVRTKLVGGVTTTYTYDALGNLTKVQRTGLQDINYVVDGIGRRIGKTVSSPAFNRRWIYRDGLHPVAEVDGVSGAILARYVYGSRPNVPDLVIKGANTYRLIVDQLGSPRMAVNVANSTDIPYRVDYSAFGVATAIGATALDWIPFGFAGGIYDADTKLVRFGARDYDPNVGRWVSRDQILFRAQEANLYLYASGDPVNFVDRSGRATEPAPWWWPGSGAGEGAGAAAGLAVSSLVLACVSALFTSADTPEGKWSCTNDSIVPSNGGSPICTYTCYNSGTGEIRPQTRLAYSKQYGPRASDMKWACMDPELVAESQGW